MRHLVGLIAALALVSACTAPAAAPSASPSQTTAVPSPTPTASAAPTSPIPKIPDPVAVVYPAFGLGLRGITVVVAQDGISGDPEFTETLTRWQLLNEPGFANANNMPLDKGHVTLSTTDKITFK